MAEPVFRDADLVSIDLSAMQSSYSGNTHCGASSSTTNGYAAGGHPNTDTIVTFSFGTDTRTTDHGNLRTAGRAYCRDNQS